MWQTSQQMLPITSPASATDNLIHIKNPKFNETKLNIHWLLNTKPRHETKIQMFHQWNFYCTFLHMAHHWHQLFYGWTRCKTSFLQRCRVDKQQHIPSPCATQTPSLEPCIPVSIIDGDSLTRTVTNLDSKRSDLLRLNTTPDSASTDTDIG